MRRLRETQPPTGWRRTLYRLPIGLYRVGLGGLLGHRFLLLEHRGRKTGLRRRVVVEVLRHDPEDGVWIVSSGWGERAQWYRNLRAHPQLTLTFGRRRLEAEARPLDPAGAEREMIRYGHRYPRAARSVARLIGWAIDGSDDDLRALAREVRLIELRRAPAQASSASRR
ncbi:MAG: nitroreductase family deazaflavin-dependent oxidoreductase [Myxococcota bacterium]